MEDNHRARKFYEKFGFLCTGDYIEDSIGGKELREMLLVLEENHLDYYYVIKAFFGLMLVAGMFSFFFFAFLMFRYRHKKDSENAKKKATIALISIICAGIGMLGSFITAYFQYY